MSFKKSIKPILVTAFNTAGITAAYQVINPLGLPYTCTKVRMVNASTIGVFISFDGVHAHDYLPPENTLELMFFNTASPGMYNPMIKKGQKIYVANGAVGVGNIYLCGYYQESL